ncbi:MAG: hypothetical protein NZ927_04400 [Candidatus Calescibacterium sp.]|nr:hypothetical protein [Candidatus Calescibacterium sp.]
MTPLKIAIEKKVIFDLKELFIVNVKKINQILIKMNKLENIRLEFCL